MRSLLMVFALCSGAAAQEEKKLDDVLQLRNDDRLLVGRVIKVEGDTIEFLRNGEKDVRRISFKEIQPYSLYRVKQDRIDKASGAARFDLGEFCMANGLYLMASREFEEAARLDKSLEEKARRKKEEAHVQDARAHFEEAKKLHMEKKYADAKEKLRILMEQYSDTEYVDQAKALDVKMTDEIKKDIEDKKAALQARKDKEVEAKAAAKEQQDKIAAGKAAELIDQAAKMWNEGLDWEAKQNLTRAERAWKDAEKVLLDARRNVDALLKSNDVDSLKKGKDLEKQTDLSLVKTYFHLGRMAAVEGNYPVAQEWLNKGLKLTHDDAAWEHRLYEMILTLAQVRMRERSTGRIIQNP